MTNQRLEEKNSMIPFFEAYKFKKEEVKGNPLCALCNKPITGSAYRVFIRLKETSHKLRRSVLVCKECAKEE